MSQVIDLKDLPWEDMFLVVRCRCGEFMSIYKTSSDELEFYTATEYEQFFNSNLLDMINKIQSGFYCQRQEH